MSTSPRLNLPYIQTQQAQKEVTHADSLNILDVLVHLTVISRTLATPPATPALGDAYIVAATATGVWLGQEGTIAVFVNNAWQFITPKIGFQAFVTAENLTLHFDSSAWSVVRNAISYLASYTVATLPSASVAGGMVYVSNASGGATVAFSDGTNWRRVQDRAIVS